jgi:ATP:cob(I)alamin adenosyltransferase
MSSEACDSGGGIRRIHVYTKTGDKGTSSLYNGERRDKDDAIFSALGDVDELNAAIGLANEFVTSEGVGISEQLTEVQSRLLDVGSAVATPVDASSPAHLSRVIFSGDHAMQLERWIDAMDDELPPLKNFILPSGGLASAHLHVARTICRRAERSVTPLSREGHVSPIVAQFLNRLSDYLFVAARFASLKAGATEHIYKKSTGLTDRPMAKS